MLSKLFSQDYIVVPREVARATGCREAIILFELIKERDYYDSKNELDDGWFCSAIENLTEMTGFSKDQIKRPMGHLAKLGLVHKESRGMPCETWYKIVSSEVISVLQDLLTKGEHDGRNQH